MKCRYCNVMLSPLRSLTDGEFCCDEHRGIFFQEKVATLVSRPASDDTSLASLHAAVTTVHSSAVLTMEPEPVAIPVAIREEPAPPLLDALIPMHFDDSFDCSAKSRKIEVAPEWQIPPRIPKLRAVPGSLVESEEGFVLNLTADELDAILRPSGYLSAACDWARKFWKTSPTDLRVITLLVPVLLGVALGPSVPKLRVPKITNSEVQQALLDRWGILHQSILNRAAVSFADDFRSGLDAWDSRSNLTTSWSYDATGFVQPGPLAIFKPSVEMSDYRFEFLGEIDRKAIGAAFRAKDLDNYYAIKFVVVKPGPLPMIHMIRYAVIHGKEGPRVEKPLPLTVRADMLYRILVDVRGSDFTIIAQGQVVDFWTDGRLPRGGVGFFCGRGERARVRWVEVSHQYDALGRLCAYLAPYPIESRNGTWN